MAAPAEVACYEAFVQQAEAAPRPLSAPTG